MAWSGPKLVGASLIVALGVACGGEEPETVDDPTGGNPTGAGGSSTGGTGGTSSVASTGGGAPGGGKPACAPDPEYPPGPYGNQVGDVIANLKLRGYRNDVGRGPATAQGVSEYTLDDARLACMGYALIHLSDYT